MTSRRTSSIRRTFGVLAIAALGLTVAACSSGDDGDAKKSDKDNSEQTSKEDSGKEDTSNKSDKSDDAVTTSTVSDEEFAAPLNKARSTLEGASGDPCIIWSGLNELNQNSSMPSSPAQVEAMIGVYGALLEQVSVALGPDTASGKATAQASEKLRSDASKADYSLKYLESNEFTEVVASEQVVKAQDEFMVLARECPGALDGAQPGAGSTAEPTPDSGEG